MSVKTTHVAERYPNWKAIAVGLVIFGAIVALIVFWAMRSVLATGNIIGMVLTTIGLLIMVSGFLLIFFGNLKINEHFVLWDNEEVQASYNEPLCISYPFHLEEQSMIKGNISTKRGPYQFSLTEFFGTEEEMIEMAAHIKTEFVVRPRTYLKLTDPKQEPIGPLTLPPGNYALKFGKYVDPLKASFSLTKTVRRKPYENLSALGLTLLEVGIPVLITGTIALGFGALVPQ